MSGEIKFSVLSHEDWGTDWTLKLPNVQGLHDIEISGHFIHYKDAPRASSWDLYAFHKLNGVEATTSAIEDVIGHGCRDRANEILESVLGPAMEADFDAWELWIADEEAAARFEASVSNAHYERNAV